MFRYEKQKQKLGFDYIIGCDEVGRGSLAGPVVAGAVLFKINDLVSKKLSWHAKVADSKKLTSKSRLLLNDVVTESAHRFGIGQVSHLQVDNLNIHNATLLAMHKAVQEILKISGIDVDKVLVCVDGRFEIPKLHMAQEAVIDGDDLIFSVSAASIVAKVYRDNLMMKLDKKFPGYDFGKHKGYGTQTHIRAIQKNGLSSIHRKSFCKKYV